MDHLTMIVSKIYSLGVLVFFSFLILYFPFPLYSLESFVASQANELPAKLEESDRQEKKLKLEIIITDEEGQQKKIRVIEEYKEKIRLIEEYILESAEFKPSRVILRSNLCDPYPEYCVGPEKYGPI